MSLVRGATLPGGLSLEAVQGRETRLLGKARGARSQAGEGREAALLEKVGCRGETCRLSMS